jgi:hypothetical protein
MPTLTGRGGDERGEAAFPSFPVRGFAVCSEVAVGEVHDRVLVVDQG